MKLLESGRLPVFLSFNRLRAGDLPDLYEKWGAARGSAAHEEAFRKALERALLHFIKEGFQEMLGESYIVGVEVVEEQLKKGNLLLLLDGFNEVNVELRPILTYGLDVLVSKSRSLRIVGSSRIEDIESYDVPFLQVELLLWNEKKQKEFLAKKLNTKNDKKIATKFWKTLTKESKEVARSPIILDMISDKEFVSEGKRKIVKGAIYDSYYRRKISNEYGTSPVAAEKMIEILSHISFDSLEEGHIVNLPRSYFYKTLDVHLFTNGARYRVFSEKEFLAATEKLDILATLAALYFLSEGITKKRLKKVLSLAYWDNVLQMLVGITDDATRAINAIQALSESETNSVGDFTVLVHCLGNAYKVSKDLTTKLFWENLRNYLNTQWLIYDYRLELLLNDWFNSLQKNQIVDFVEYLRESGDSEELPVGLKIKIQESLDNDAYSSVEALLEDKSHGILLKAYKENEKLDWPRAVEILEAFVPQGADFFGLDRKFFLTSVAHSVSLSVNEKIKICISLPMINKFQLHALIAIFDEETIKFATLDQEHFSQLVQLRENSFHDIILYKAREYIREADYVNAFKEFDRLLSEKYFSIIILQEAFQNREHFSDEHKAVLGKYAENYQLPRNSDFSRAISFFLEYDYKDQLRDMLKQKQNDLSTFLEFKNAAIAYNKLAQYESALYCLHLSLEKLPKIDKREKIFIYDYLSDNELELERREKALQHLTTGINEVDAPRLYLSRAKVLNQVNRYSEAYEDFCKFWSFIKDNHEDYDDKSSQSGVFNEFIPSMIKCLVNLDKIDELDEYLDFFDKIPKRDLLRYAAHYLQQNKAYRESISKAEKGLDIAPSDTGLRDCLINNYRYLKKFDSEKDEIEAYFKLVKAKISNWESHIGNPNLGFYYFRLGKYDLAQKYLEKALENEPKAPISTANLGHVKLMQRDAEAAYELYSQVIDAADDESEVTDYIIKDIEQLIAEFPKLNSLKEMRQKLEKRIKQKFHS